MPETPLTVDHIGFVVGDLAAAEAFFVHQLGFSVERRISIDQRLDAVFLRAGPLKLELIEEYDAAPGTPSQLPPHHVAFAVPDLGAAMAVLGEVGVETTGDVPSRAGGAPSHFTRPESTGGVACQFVERKRP